VAILSFLTFAPWLSSYEKELYKRVYEAALQVYVEQNILKEFADFADELGYAVPINEIPSINGDFLINLTESISSIKLETPTLLKSKGIHRELWDSEVLAFAQHHGIPTRYLDWTRNPLFAAYFAVADAIENPPESGYLAVYAYQTSWFQSYLYDEADIASNVRLINYPQSKNNFMQSQAGLFTIDYEAEKFFLSHGEYPDLMSSLIFREAPNVIVNPNEKPLRFLLDTKHTAKLLRILFLEGITKAHLQPTLDNVAKTVNLKWLYPDSVVKEMGRTKSKRK